MNTQKAIIFDLDGTLIDSLEDIAVCMNQVFQEMALPTHEINDYKKFVGGGVDILVENGMAEKANQFFKSPQDVLRYLWFKHTGFLQIIEPKTIAKRLKNNAQNLHPTLDNSVQTGIKAVQDLKLKFNRTDMLKVRCSISPFK